MQKAATSTLDAQAKTEKPVITKLLDISTDDKGLVYVNWPVDKKDLCIPALCEAIKLVSTYQAPIIEKPKPNFMDFVKGIKR